MDIPSFLAGGSLQSLSKGKEKNGTAGETDAENAANFSEPGLEALTVQGDLIVSKGGQDFKSLIEDAELEFAVSLDATAELKDGENSDTDSFDLDLRDIAKADASAEDALLLQEIDSPKEPSPAGVDLKTWAATSNAGSEVPEVPLESELQIPKAASNSIDTSDITNGILGGSSDVKGNPDGTVFADPEMHQQSQSVKASVTDNLLKHELPEAPHLQKTNATAVLDTTGEVELPKVREATASLAETLSDPDNLTKPEFVKSVDQSVAGRTQASEAIAQSMQVQVPRAEVERAISAPAPASNIELSKVGELSPLERRRIDIENRAFQAPVNSNGAGGGQVTTAHAGQSIGEGSAANLSASQNLTEQLPEEAIQFDDVPTEDFSLPPREATNRSAAQANPPPPTGTTVLTPTLVTTQLTSEIALDADSPMDVQFEETFRSSASERSNLSTAVLASAPRVVAQVANHLIANINSALMTGERSVELRLDPPELGRVILTLTPADQGISGQVLAERSDTLELLRRSLDELARELHDQGFGDVALSLGAFEDNSDPSRNFAEDAPDEFLGSDVPPDETQTIHLSLTNERLDIRL